MKHVVTFLNENLNGLCLELIKKEHDCVLETLLIGQLKANIGVAGKPATRLY